MVSSLLLLAILLCIFDFGSYFTHLWVFHTRLIWWFSTGDSKSPQGSMIFPSILAHLNNAVFWMVSIHSLIFKSSSPFTNLLVTVPSAPIIISSTVTFMFHSCCFFFIIMQGPGIYLSFRFLSILPCGQPERLSPLFGRFSFFFCFFVFYSPWVFFLLSQGLDVLPRWSVVKHFQNGFWVEHIAFVRMVKFKFLAK